MNLITRFFHKALRDMGMVEGNEPFKKLLTQGMVLKDGAKMSKSKGNTVDPQSYIEKYGADTDTQKNLPKTILSVGEIPKEAPEKEFVAEKSDDGFDDEYEDEFKDEFESLEEELALRRKSHATLKKVANDYEVRFAFNTAIASIMELLNFIPEEFKTDNASDAQKFCLDEAIIFILKMLSPITPHITEHLWNDFFIDDLSVESCVVIKKKSTR